MRIGGTKGKVLVETGAIVCLLTTEILPKVAGLSRKPRLNPQLKRYRGGLLLDENRPEKLD